MLRVMQSPGHWRSPGPKLFIALEAWVQFPSVAPHDLNCASYDRKRYGCQISHNVYGPMAVRDPNGAVRHSDE